jgi:hypothetical protein
LIGLVFVAGCAVGGASSGFVVPPARAQDQQRFDYFCFEARTPDDVMQKARQAGAQGWELAASTGSTGYYVWCFKRPI